MNIELPAPSAEASTSVDAPPEDVWNCVATIQNLSHHSPETIRTEWLSGSQRHEVGARFRGHDTNGRHRWHTDCTISEYTEPTAFAFDLEPDEHGNYATRWRYTLTAEGNGTRLTESFESPVLDDRPSEMNPDQRRVLIDMLGATLASVKHDLEIVARGGLS